MIFPTALRLPPFLYSVVSLRMLCVKLSFLLGLVHGLKLFSLLLSLLVTQVLILAGNLAAFELLNVVEVPGILLFVLKVLLDLWFGFTVSLHKGVGSRGSELAREFLGTQNVGSLLNRVNSVLGFGFVLGLWFFGWKQEIGQVSDSMVGVVILWDFFD